MDVLREEMLMHEIFMYQDGVYHDLYPVIRAFNPLTHAILSHAATLRFGWSHRGVLFQGLLEYIESFQDVFVSWYSQWGIKGINRLYRCIQNKDLIEIIHVYGALTGDLNLIPIQPHLPILLFDIAAWYNHLNVIEYLQHTCPISRVDELAMDGAAANGHLEVVEYLHGLGGKTRYAMNLAASNGHLEVVQFLHEYRSNIERCTKRAMDEAAANGHLKVVEFLHTHRDEGCTRAALDSAAIHGHTEVVRYLLTNRHEGYSAGISSKAKKQKMSEIADLLDAHPHLCVVYPHDRSFHTS